ncbi:MAG: 6-phosphofructokinase [Clostridiales bacterium]|nr:6-phosphofructokinase [Clostridiales bacterium]
MKTIAVLTSGGDAPGMNAAIRAVVRTACENGAKVYGAVRGFNGLINDDFEELGLRSVSDIIHRGGTMLYSARSEEFRTEAGMQKAVAVCRKRGIEGVVVIGGDGSFRGARDLSERGIPCVALPGTIDNDIACCDYTIGYDTAMNTVMEMVDRVRDTTESHDRCSVVEVMGRSAGYLALNAGIAVGATSILIPEVRFDIETHVFERMQRAQKTGKVHFLIMVAEGVQGTDVKELAQQIHETTGVESRSMVLGHVQRGGSPTVRDRVVASQMGNYAANLVFQGIGNRVVAMQQERILDLDIFEALQMTKTLDMGLYDLEHKISI